MSSFYSYCQAYLAITHKKFHGNNQYGQILTGLYSYYIEKNGMRANST